MNFYKFYIIINFVVFIPLGLLLTTGCAEKKIDFSPVLNGISNANNSLNDSLNTKSKDIGKHMNEVVNKIKDLENANLQAKNDVLNYLKTNVNLKEKIETIVIEVSKNGITEEERKKLFENIRNIENGLNNIDKFTKGIEKIEPTLIDDKGIKKNDQGTAARITDPTMERIASKVVDALKDPSNSPDPKIQDEKNKSFADLLLKSIIKANENLAKDISLSKDQQLQFTKNAQKDEQIKNLKSELDDLKLILKNEKKGFKGPAGHFAILLTNSKDFELTEPILSAILVAVEKQNKESNGVQKLGVYAATGNSIDIKFNLKKRIRGLKPTEMDVANARPTETIAEVGKTFLEYAFDDGKEPIIPVNERKAIIIATWAAGAPKNNDGWDNISQVDAILIQTPKANQLREGSAWLDFILKKNGRLLFVQAEEKINGSSPAIDQLQRHLSTLLNTKKD